MQRFKIDARAELVTAEGKLASAQHGLENATNEEQIAIRTRAVNAIERRCEELRAEIERLPDRPALHFGAYGNFPCLTRTEPFTAAELEGFPEIPDFLRRAPALAEERSEVEW